MNLDSLTRKKSIVRRKKLIKSLEATSYITHNPNRPKIVVPSGTIQSYLSNEHSNGNFLMFENILHTFLVEKKLSYALYPQIDNSGLGFKDLFYDSKKLRV